MISFYVVRHGETLLNSLGRAQGWSDSPLTANGKKTAKLILSSNGNVSLKIQKDIRLREWCLGNMEAEQNSIFSQRVSDWLRELHLPN